MANKRHTKVVSLEAFRKKKLAATHTPVNSVLIDTQLKNEFMRHIAPSILDLLSINGFSDKEKSEMLLHLCSEWVILLKVRRAKEKL
jgi:hypothetical protein